ncbi:MAG: hypothetical protein OWQ59_03470 [Alicyclobacillaceae bacterium]|uniref:hypothetical protein n=1 Tax=Alicyclobacillus sp. SP_1 TaxID=2942475 RepID=UPI002157E86F|nr:hypothetical protein [Alicyclobacillus sp. SP_1]MCY0887496.1 hypothetical protein [Alicyclobacillaceae bacterium]MCY0896238.1 hypothetical protein [Alicyclobacillaceae bacterium]
MLYWIVLGLVMAVLIGLYLWLFFYSRRKQKAFDEQYTAMKERHEVFVLNKKTVRERPKSGWRKFTRFKTYQVVGRVNVSQAMKGMQMSRMQTVTFQTTKQEYEKIEINRKYKMDIAGNYIGNVIAIGSKTSAKKSGKDKSSSSSVSKKGTRSWRNWLRTKS